MRGIQIYKDFPEIDVSVFSIQSSKLPDFNMYKKMTNVQPEELNPENPLNQAEQVKEEI